MTPSGSEVALGSRPPLRAVRRWTTVAALLAGFAAALAVRVAAGGPQVARSGPAGLLFAGLLALLVVTAGAPAGARGRFRGRPPGRSVGPGLVTGLTGAAVLCLPPLLRVLDGTAPHRPAGSFLRWGLVIVVVATAEEAFLRGRLHTAVRQAVAAQAGSAVAGDVIPIAVTAVAFGLMHVPLYGWAAFPLDLAVGVWLGTLRAVSGTVTAPAVAHGVADLAGWWLR